MTHCHGTTTGGFRAVAALSPCHRRAGISRWHTSSGAFQTGLHTAGGHLVDVYTQQHAVCRECALVRACIHSFFMRESWRKCTRVYSSYIFVCI